MRHFEKLGLALATVGLVAVAGCTGTTTATTTNAYVDDTEPADKLYNQALANMDAGNLKEAQKKFAKVDRQHPYSVHGRKAQVMQTFHLLPFQGLPDRHRRRKSLRANSFPLRRGGALHAVPRRHVLPQADHRRDARPEGRQECARRLHHLDRALPGLRVRAGRQEEDPHRARPARRQVDAGRPLLPGAPRALGRDQPLPPRGGRRIPTRATWRRPCSA